MAPMHLRKTDALGHPPQEIDPVLIMPHIGNRTVKSVERQALSTTTCLIEYLMGGKNYIQANRFRALREIELSLKQAPGKKSGYTVSPSKTYYGLRQSGGIRLCSYFST